MVKIVKINKSNRDRLKTIQEDSINNNMDYLMDTVEKEMPFVRYSDEVTSINLHDRITERLDSFKITNGESRDNIITRMLIEYDKLGLDTEEYFIPFRLTSTLNKNLQLSCMLEANSSTFVFDNGNGVYDTKLSITYKAEGKDLSAEFQSWINMLNWAEIERLVLDNNQDLFTIKKTTYYLEVNYL